MWGYDYFGGTRTVDVHVRRLRAKLGPEHETLIGTVRNVGYRFVLPSKGEQASELPSPRSTRRADRPAGRLDERCLAGAAPGSAALGGPAPLVEAALRLQHLGEVALQGGAERTPVVLVAVDPGQWCVPRSRRSGSRCRAA